MVLFACVVLVDRRGWVLLQERDEHARTAPECWGLVGGDLEGDEDPVAGALRELEEETTLRIAPRELTPLGKYDVHHVETGLTERMWLYAAAVDLTDDDVECHEGRQIAFVAPDVVPTLPLSDSARQALLPFLESELYRTLAS